MPKFAWQPDMQRDLWSQSQTKLSPRRYSAQLALAIVCSRELQTAASLNYSILSSTEHSYLSIYFIFLKVLYRTLGGEAGIKITKYLNSA